ncbi:FxSxx-COOH system tetratricopeptide repeat protein [Streptomyces sp. NBC_01176]|uniref:FxSxx-COOH system tetratricopeptide repeat protein n=1 Tax=Streptomyces sp. NBC_01176 TaxID=2903760 RepID=UPI00386357C3|nr:FxSxx-COOH system tetratricopeptide repeat protein [Streptomyces sp. NBC_01176]
MSHTGAATASAGGLANTGHLAIDGFTLVQQAAPRTPAAWPHQVGVLPPRALSFQHRAEADQLRAAVDSGGTAVLGQVLTGTGGVGKTQLAADYARTAWDNGAIDVLVWISASSRSAITAGYAQAAVEFLAVDPGDPEQAARTFLAWLEPKAGQKPCRWLVVLDDVADPADMRGWWPPASPHGRVLVTSRRREAALTGAGRRLVTVGLFRPTEAAAYFTAVLAAHARHEPIDQIDGLAADLGYLPLALAQAAAYIIDATLTCASYRDLLASRIERLGDLLPEPGALPDDQTDTVAATWALSVERAGRLSPAGLARPMLRLAAMLSPNGIPSAVLGSEPALAYLTACRTLRAETGRRRRRLWGRRQGQARVTATEAGAVLGVLHRLSLIDHTPADPHQAVRVHQLVQRVVRDSLTPHQYNRLARAAADALTAVWPEIERDTTLAQVLRANATALAHYGEDALYQKNGVHPVLHRLGRSFGNTGQVAAAVGYFERLADTADHRLGPRHRMTLGIRSDLAHWRGEAGDAAGAATAYAALLADRERVLGSRHPDTLATRNNLAAWRGAAGDAAGAATAYAELLPDWERVRGPSHPTTLTVRHNLASWRGEAGDAVGAATAYAALLEQTLRILGPDHPTTLIMRNSLARWRGEAGDAVSSAAAYADLVTDFERLLGPDHPATLAIRNNLALWQGKAGDAAGAAAALAELLADQERVLGPDHPDTLTTHNNLAAWRGTAGDAAGAATALAELLADQERVLGPDHPDTLTTHSNLAAWRGTAGDAAGAATALAELLEQTLRVLGPDHPTTLTTRHNLTLWRGEAGDAAYAAAAYAELLADRERVLGPHHPDTLTTHNNLALWRGRAGDALGAATTFARLLADFERILGPDHPTTLTTRHNLASWRGETGDAAGAATALADLLVDRERVLGSLHPDTLATRNNLATCRGKAGDAAGAAAAFAELLADFKRVLGPDHPTTLTVEGSLARWRREAVDTADQPTD